MANGKIIATPRTPALAQDFSALIDAAHHGPRFTNPYEEHVAQTIAVGLKWWILRDTYADVRNFRDQVPMERTDVTRIAGPSVKPRVTWLGHASVLLQYKGVNVLFDPMFSSKCSAFPIFGPRRYTPPPVSAHELPPIHYLVISHNHFDHLDYPTVINFRKSSVMAPLGLCEWFASRGFRRVRELDWWQTHRDHVRGQRVRFVFTPTQHWSRRGLFDRDKTLWGSWMVEIADMRFWFAGDTGYNDVQFRQIGRELGPFDGAAIPIGAYAPRELMERCHIDPAQSVQVHQDVRSKWTLGVHWGTFPLSDEPILDPPRKLRAQLKKQHVPLKAFTTIPIGATRVF